MGKLGDAYEAVADNVAGMVKSPGKQFKKAAGVAIDIMKNNGEIGAAANALSARPSDIDAQVDKAMGKDMGEIGKRWDDSFQK